VLLVLEQLISGLLEVEEEVQLGMVLGICLGVTVVLGMDLLLYLVDHMQVVVKDKWDLDK
jgi:hypothetical protein